jgi:F0F1-type ATP synthase membrane subunit b/b'
MVASVAWGVLLASGSPIDLDGTFFLQVGIFFVAFFILKSLVFEPVVELFDAREAAMSGAKKDADTMNADAAAKREHLESELRRVRQVSTEHRDRLRAEAQTLARKLAEAARRESAATLANSRTQLDVQAQDVRKRALAEAPQLAKQIAERLLARSVS